MRVLLVYCHPDPESFTAAVKATAVSALSAAGHVVDVLDLYAEDFDPVMGRDERRTYHTAGANVEPEPIAAHLDRLKAAEALVFVYPTWWYGQPAMLKGWLDRVFVPHATFTMPVDNKPIMGLLQNIRVIAAVTTLGSPRWWWLLVGQPGRRVLLRGIRALCHRRCRTVWLALHRMDEVGDDARRGFLARVDSTLRSL